MIYQVPMESNACFDPSLAKNDILDLIVGPIVPMPINTDWILDINILT